MLGHFGVATDAQGTKVFFPVIVFQSVNMVDLQKSFSPLRSVSHFSHFHYRSCSISMGRFFRDL